MPRILTVVGFMLIGSVLSLAVWRGPGGQAMAQVPADKEANDVVNWKAAATGTVDVYLHPEPVSALRPSLVGVTLEDARATNDGTLLSFKEAKTGDRWIVNGTHVTAIRIAGKK